MFPMYPSYYLGWVLSLEFENAVVNSSSCIVSSPPFNFIEIELFFIVSLIFLDGYVFQ